MNENVYQWAEGSDVPISCQVAGERLEYLAEKFGELTTQIVLDDAQKKKSVLHDAFEWDDAVAANGFRIHQARHMLNHLQVIIKENPAGPPIKAFISFPKGDGGKHDYKPLAAVLSDAELRKSMVQRAWNELQAWRKRYEQYSELAGYVAAIDQIGPPEIVEAIAS